ncbi:MAG: hypothetical protein KDA42_01150 [Planctomycetales bacterium]|nr:hypothetical protein [Planctomycetales bacterium]
MRIVLFEDEHVERLYPITVSRPAFAITCGGQRLLDLLTELDADLRAIVRPYLKSVMEANRPGITDTASLDDSPWLLVNARLAPTIAARESLRRLIRESKPGRWSVDGSLVAALIDRATAQRLHETPAQPLTEQVAHLEAFTATDELTLLAYPHDVLQHHLASINDHLEERISRGEYRQLQDGVFVAPGATLGDYSVVDTKHGPILLEEDASIGPYCFLQGPVWVRQRSRVIEHAAIKDKVVLGATTKIGGEVEASIIEPYTNKQHHGFLGHSYVGSWINLGAGTCNSDLKNTYGTVKMQYGDEKVPTGMQFVGAVIGDYSKSAINTGIFTGKTIGVCSMVYGFVTTNVPSFVNYARLFGQVTATPVEVMVATQARMFARRNVEQRTCDIQLLHDMFDLTRGERELGSVPPEPLSL